MVVPLRYVTAEVGVYTFMPVCIMYVYMYVCSCVYAYENSGMYHRLCPCTKAPDPPRPGGTVIGCRGDGFAWYCGHASIMRIPIMCANDLLIVCLIFCEYMSVCMRLCLYTCM